MRFLLILLRNLFVNGRRLLGRALLWLLRRKPPEYVRFRLQGAVPLRRAESQLPRLVRRLFRTPPDLSFEALDRRLTRIASCRRTRGIVISVGSLRLGWGRVMALRERLAQFRESGKDVVVHLEEGGNLEYFLASVGRLIVASPGGHVWLTGLATQVLFYREVLDKLSAEPEVLTAGRYKNALEPFVKSEMSQEHREALESIVDDLAQGVIQGVATGRDLTPDQVQALVDAGPYSPGQALEANLVDHVAYEDELEALLGQDNDKASIQDWDAFQRRTGRPLEWIPLWGRRRIGYLDLHGIIQSGESSRTPWGGPTVGHETVCEALKEARETRAIRAVLLHVDSRGGSGSASDRIWHEVRLLAEKKPVVAFLGDVAASGGYFVACGADHVVASRGCLTGSIGVLSGKVNLSGLLARIGIRPQTVKRGASADLLSTSRGYTEDERRRLQDHIQAFYDDFVDKVARSRKLEREQVARVAEGRVWTGGQALDHGLVDELGTFATALARVRKRAGVSPDGYAPLVDLGSPPPLIQLPGGLGPLARLLGDGASLDALLAVAAEPVLCLQPYDLRIR